MREHIVFLLRYCCSLTPIRCKSHCKDHELRVAPLHPFATSTCFWVETDQHLKETCHMLLSLGGVSFFVGLKGLKKTYQ